MKISTVIKLFIAVTILTVTVMFLVNRQDDSQQPASGPIFTSQEECEEVTTMECSFSNCDYVPEGENYEELCDNVGKQWLPILEDSY
jgi:hypothetical protein